MDSLLRLLLRFIVVPLGYACGMVATVAVVLVGYWQIGDLLQNVSDPQFIAILDALMVAAMALMAVVLTMWAIASIGILFAEMFAVRSWLFHAANGAVSAWLAAQLFTPYDAEATTLFDGDLYILGAGLAGGLAYWLVAGWSAGFWKPLSGPPAQPLPPPARPEPLPPPAPDVPR